MMSALHAEYPQSESGQAQILNFLNIGEILNKIY